MKLYMFLLSVINSVFGYKPVVLVHGVLSEAKNLEDLKDLIEETHPGTNVTLVKLYPEVESFVPLTHQLKYWRDKLNPIMESASDGIHLICHSQGGLICQGIIEENNHHNIHTFIALSSPINGQFGIPKLIEGYLPWLKGSRESLTKYMYTTFTQDTFAISNYWRDPRSNYQEEYLYEAKYLPKFQNQPGAYGYKPQDAAQRKKNFLRIKKFVCIGGPDDGVITPWYSSIYGFYDVNYNFSSMKNQSVFLEDWFGLQTIYNRGDFTAYSIEGVKHIEWHGNKHVFHTAIEPWII